MIKVYLLLRNNKQFGPYSLEELSHQQLKPLDLIWIEGRSAAWKYASEITELRSFLPQADASNEAGSHDAYLPKAGNTSSVSSESAPKKVYVSLPANAVQKTVTESARPATPIAHQPEPEPMQPEAEKEKLVTKYSSTLEEKEEVYTQWIYNTKSRKTTLAPEWIGGIAVVILLLMGSAAYYIKNRTSEPAEVAAITPSDTRGVEELSSTPEEPVINETPAQTTYVPEPAPQAVAPVPAQNVGPNTQPAIAKPVQQKQQASLAGNATKQKVQTTSATSGNQPVAIKEDASSAQPIAETPAPTGQQKSSKTTAETAESKEKKKSFSDKVDGFFNKLVHAKKVEPGAPAGTTTEPPVTDADRKAVRRGEAPVTSAPAKKDLTAGVQLTTIEPSNTWMQGVHGLRMKIENKNDVRISNASVEVKYMNDQNAVIEKRTIRLNPISPGKQITMDIPDHRLADHAVATVLSAEN